MTAGIKRELQSTDFAAIEPVASRIVAYQDHRNNLTLRKVSTTWYHAMNQTFDRRVKWCCDDLRNLNEPLSSNIRFISLDFHQNVELIPMNVEEVEIFNAEVSLKEVPLLQFPMHLKWLRKLIMNGGHDYLKVLDVSALPHLEYLDLDRFSGKLFLPNAPTLKVLITGDDFNEPLDLSQQTALESLTIRNIDYQHPLYLENLTALKEVIIPYQFEQLLIREGDKHYIVPLLNLPILLPKNWERTEMAIEDNMIRFYEPIPK